MNEEQRILNFTKHTSVALFYLTFIFTCFNASLPVTLGVLLGGLLVTINFNLLCKSVKKALTPPYIADVSSVLTKYFLRFSISIIVITALIISGYVHPVGLIIGLSVVVASFFLTAFNETLRIIFKV